MIEITVHLDAPVSRVWSELADLGSHHQWMADAGEIRFLDERTAGLGARMVVPTRVGPFRTTDLMTVVEWDPGRAIGVSHVGAVSGTGRFEIEPYGEGTKLTWSEQLRFPWWLGGAVGARLARPVLKRVWTGNLKRFADRVGLSGL